MKAACSVKMAEISRMRNELVSQFKAHNTNLTDVRFEITIFWSTPSVEALVSVSLVPFVAIVAFRVP